MKAIKAGLLSMNVLLLGSGCFLAVWAGAERIKAGLWIFILLSGMLNFGYYIYFRKRFINFSKEICRNTERIMRGEKDGSVLNQETLTSKVVMELEKLEDIIQNRLSESEAEKEQLQKTISELSHQLKTPLANIVMYQEMLEEPDMDRQQAEYFMGIIRQQLGKLEFLIDTLIKSSRLEFDMIKLNPENSSVLHTLKLALNGIVARAEKKKLELLVRCRPTIQLSHDAKWTAEALENILDNAVKYTQEGGCISIDVVPGEMYVEIKIQDTGRGIAPEHYNDIFKRFYREKSVSGQEGLGLGLYIARTIITLQGGYILVRSEKEQGSCFSVFLPNR